MEEILRVRVKHNIKKPKNNDADGPSAKRQKLDLRKLNMQDLMAPYGEVDQYRINTPHSAFVKLKDLEGMKKAKLGLNMKTFNDEQCFGSLHVDIVKRDAFTRTDFGPKSVPRNGGVEKIKGLFLIQDFIDEATESKLVDYFQNSDSAWEKPPEDKKKPSKLEEIPSQPTRRRVQHYGYKFDYVTRRGDTDNPLDNWPDIIVSLREEVNKAVRKSLDNGFNWTSDQATVNEYVAGEGIAKHIDTHSAFEDGIASVSVGSDCVFRFGPGDDDSEDKVIEIFIPRRSIFIMTGESRYYFTHQMPQRTSDKVDGKILYRGTRFSVTFRHIKYTPCECAYNKSLCE